MNRQQRRAATKADPDARQAEFARLFSVAKVKAAGRAFQDAVSALRRADRLQPDIPEIHFELGQALLNLGKADDALAAYRKALSLKPGYTDAMVGTGCALESLGRMDEAIAAFRQRLIADPSLTSLWSYSQYCRALSRLGRYDEAIALCRRGLAANPRDPEAHFNLSLLLLLTGQLREGFSEFEWRKDIPSFNIFRFRQPQWNGEDISQKTLLVHAEQGLGDVIHFARYLPLLEGRAKKVIFAVPPSLTALLKDLPGVDELVTGDGPAPFFDLQTPLLSLPKVFGTALDSIPANIPYLRPDRHRAKAMAERVGELATEALKVGLVWSGDPRPHDPISSAMDRRRSIRLAEFAPLAEIAGIRLFSLQKGPAAAQARRSAVKLIDHMDDIEDFADTAALIAHLELVITVDTSVAHLAGALGVPVWILTRMDGCWRWFLDGDETPWYPTARLFRQESYGEWASVIRRVADSLAELAGRHRCCPPAVDQSLEGPSASTT